MDWERIEDLLDRALRRPAAERESYVREVTASQPDLRAQVLSLLAHADSGRDLFDTLGKGLPRPFEAPTLRSEEASLTGTAVGRYRIGRLIGAGGMGEVWAAWDPTLERQVALKFLAPDRTMSAPDGRLLAEARAVAALEHPNVCTIHEVGESPDGRTFLAMPYYEGMTLKSLLAREGPLTVVDAATYGAQVAAGLAAAHDRGIVHGDVKPGNVIVTAGGVAKLLDFGIAVRQDRVARGPGQPVGTLRYMSPEQLVGEAIGPPSDVWSLGVTLYELISGAPPFRGESPSELIRKIRTEVPDPLHDPSDLPAGFETLLGRCLAKDAGDRPSVSAVGRSLETWRGDRTSEAGSPPESGADVSPRDLHIWNDSIPETSSGDTSITLPLHRRIVSALLTVAALIAFVTAIRGRTEVPVPAVSARSWRLPAPTDLGSWMALSPDGNQMAVVGADWNPMRVFGLGDSAGVELPGTDRAVQPFFSVDGASIGFVSGRSLGVAPTQGGPGVTIVPFLPFAVNGGAWRDSTHIVLGSLDSGLWEVALRPGSDPVLRQLRSPDSTAREAAYRYPSVLPGGHVALLEVFYADTLIRPAALDLETGNYTVLSHPGRGPRFAQGQVVYEHWGNLQAVPFDPVTLAETGPHRRLPLAANPRGTGADFDVVDDRIVLVRPRAPSQRLVEVAMDGRERRLHREEREFQRARYSPDSRQILATVLNPSPMRLWLIDLGSGTWTQISARFAETGGQWTRDGRSILYSGQLRQRRVSWSVFERRFPELDTPRPVLPGPAWFQAVSSDGDWVLYQALPERSLRALQRSTGRDVLVSESAGVGDFSPDGGYVAYQAADLDAGAGVGLTQVHVQSFPEPGDPIRLSPDRGYGPRWSPDGRQVFYRDGRNVIAVRLETHPELRVVDRRILFPDVYDQKVFDVHPSGDRFLMARERDPWMLVEIVDHWTALLDKAEVVASEGSGSLDPGH
jgi:serine/threonine protein kinase